MTQSAEGKLGDPKWTDFPGSLNIATEGVFEVAEHGTHIFRTCIVMANEPEIITEVDFYVRDGATEDTAV